MAVHEDTFLRYLNRPTWESRLGLLFRSYRPRGRIVSVYGRLQPGVVHNPGKPR